MTTSTLTYNIVTNEGEDASVVVFAGSDQLIATRTHPNFANIIAALRGEQSLTDDELVGLFDVTRALAGKFDRLSDRITARQGRVYLDLVEVDTALTQAIARYWVEGHADLMPLVNFMEKIEQNPNQHSKEHLFGWLGKHGYSLAPDGDFIAYKGVDRSGDGFKSKSSGHAMVNGEEINGRIPNFPGAIIEMPRNEVAHDPRMECSTGLHAGNWRYASTFATTTIRVKINPRDVVSVPTDSNGEKLRCCRYVVMEPVTKEDSKFLQVADALKTRHVPRSVKVAEAEMVKPHEDEPDVESVETPDARRRRGAPAKKAAGKKKAAAPKKKAPAAKKAAAPKPKPEPVERVYPEHYEKFSRVEFDSLTLGELRWLAKEWEIARSSSLPKPKLVDALVAEAKERLKTW